jgi:cytochrome P450
MSNDEEVAAVDAEAREQMMAKLFDMSAPQSNYRSFNEHGGWIDADGLAFSFDRTNTQFVLKNHELFSSVVEMGLGNTRPLIPLNVDPPNHSKYRKLLDPLFAPRRMDEQEEDLTARVNRLIDGFIDKGECNFTEDFAEVFPSLVFIGLCGLPEDEVDRFIRMRNGILHPDRIDPEAVMPNHDKLMEVRNAMGQEIYTYFGDLVEKRRAVPAEDLITRFVQAEVDGDKLSKDDICDIMFLFVIAGLDTVSDTLTCFFAFLAQNPDHRQQIIDDPSIIPSAVEELLRWESPVPNGVPRVATQDVELPGGQKVLSGCPVIVNYGAADVDDDAFGDPFEVRFDRIDNPHIAFGAGVHRCLGSHLARRELRVTLREWHRRIPHYGLKPGHEELVYPPGLRHVEDLTLSWPT